MIRTFLMTAAFVFAFGCSKKAADSGGSATTGGTASASGTGSGTASGTGAGPASPDQIAADQMGTFVCKDVQSDACVGPSERFEATVPVVHVTYKTTDLPKVGEVYVIQWIAEDVGDAAPPNSVIGTLNEEVKEVAPGTTSYVVNSKLTKPTAGWPVGKYRVEVKRNDKLETTARFSIE